MVRRLAVVTVVGAAIWAGAQVVAQQNAPAKSTPAAQAKSAPSADLSKMPLMNVNIVQVKPELLTEWQEFQKNETMPMLQKAGVKERSASSTVIGPAFEYVFLTPMTSFADRDGEGPVVKALGQDGARAYGQKSRRFIASQRTYAVRQRTDLSYMPDPAAPLPIAVVSEYSIVAGHMPDFANYIKTDMTPAHKQLKTGGFVVYQLLFGGGGNGFVVVTLLHNFADLDKGPAITQAYGEARAAAIQQKLGGIVEHVERTVAREVPELSFKTRAVTQRR